MQATYIKGGLGGVAILLLTVLAFIYLRPGPADPFLSEEKDKRAEIADRFEQEYIMTVDPALGVIPRQRLLKAYDIAEAKRQMRAGDDLPVYWMERGPNNVGGRTRALLVDANDASGQTVWAGSVSGGLWRTNNIDAGNPTWVPINDLFQNLAVTSIVQDPTNSNNLFFGTGEAWGNQDQVQGLGVWASTDGGATWTQMPPLTPTGSPDVNKLLFDNAGTLYAATENRLLRFDPLMGVWNPILGAGLGANSNFITDIELAANGDLYAATWGDGIYRSTNGGNNWGPALTGGLPTANFGRIELATAPGNAGTLYAIFADTTSANSGGCLSIWQSTNFGANWTAGTCPANFGTQAWYDLILAVDPNDANRVWVGGVGIAVSADGGSTWTALGGIHVDHHAIVYYAGDSDQILFGNDGGVYKSYDGSAGSPTFADKNATYNVTQFYAVAVHPDQGSNYMLGGTQDNATPKFQNPGINATTCVLCCCDGGWTFIDQDNPDIQIASTQDGSFNVSTDGGGSFSNIVSGNTNRLFITPADYDDATNVLYYSDTGGRFGRVTDVGGTNTQTSDTIPAFGGARVTALAVSPSVTNRVYMAAGGIVFQVDNAHQAGMATVTNINGPGNGFISSLAIDPTNEQHLLLTRSNFGLISVMETTDGGTNWNSVEGDLPDMPVRWIMFWPNETDKAMIATELGVWYTKDLDGGNTVWYPTNEFGLANCRVDMLQTRASDDLVVAATHGRGMYTTDYFSLLNACPSNVSVPGNIAPGLYMASEFITSDGTIDGGEAVIFQAGEEVELLPDFTAVAGSNFWALIKDCTPAAPVSPDEFFSEEPAADIPGIPEEDVQLELGDTRDDTWSTMPDAEMLVLPNPTREVGTVRLTMTERQSVRLYLMDAQGRLARQLVVGTLDAGPHEFSFDVADLAQGVYLVVLQTPLGAQSERILVVK